MRKHPFRFGVVAETTAGGDEWRALSCRVEAVGCSNFLVSDHFGAQLAMIPALAAAADATDHVRVGAHVACNDYRHPVTYAKELATLDLLSGGRTDWGIGAGWLAAEYEKAGLTFDPAPVRVSRCIEAVAVMKGLFADDPFTFSGDHYRVNDLDGMPKPIQRPHPPLLIGAAGRRMLSFAAREADVIGVAPSISARRVGDAPARQTVEQAVDEQLTWIRAAAGTRVDALELNMVAFPAVVTNTPTATAENVAPHIGLTPDEVMRSPHVWIGSVDTICERLEHHRERWGVSYWAIPAGALPAMTPVIERLRGA